MNIALAIPYGILILLYALPTVAQNVPQHALTQSMLVIVGAMLLLTTNGGDDGS